MHLWLAGVGPRRRCACSINALLPAARTVAAALLLQLSVAIVCCCGGGCSIHMVWGGGACAAGAAAAALDGAAEPTGIPCTGSGAVICLLLGIRGKLPD